MKILNKILGKEPQEPKAEMVSYLTKELVTSLNNKAVKRKANRSLQDNFVENLSETNKFPIIQTLLHNDVEMRCNIVFNVVGKDAVTGWLDIPLKEYHSLPKFANFS